jgi:hypothetical protein
MKMDMLVKGGTLLVNCLFVARRRDNQAKIEGAVQSLGVPFVSMSRCAKGVLVEVAQAHIYKYLDKAFEEAFFEDYAFHLADDEDDDLPEGTLF